MSENNERKEEAELSEDIIETEEVVSVDESKDKSETLIKEEVVAVSDKEVDSSFIARFTANLIDQVFVLALTLVVFFVAKGILYLCGFQIAEGYAATMFLIEYVVINVLYVPILEVTKLKKTLGKELLKVK